MHCVAHIFQSCNDAINVIQ